MIWRMREGDCLDVMATLEPASVDAIVTDPPYGLAFMGKQWDHGVPGVPFWEAALRVAKPGAHLLAFGGTRTYHRLTCAIEDAGWEIRDCLSWLYGSGFPKSHDVAKAIDKAAGVEGTFGAPKTAAHAEWVKRGRMRGEHGHEGLQRPWMDDADAVDRNARTYLPATADAQRWQGWGTALKPAWEPIILARKPLVGTVAANVAAHGTGALNVDGCRIAFASADDLAESTDKNQHSRYANPGSNRDSYSGHMPPRRDYDGGAGRWPANVVLDEDAAAVLDAQSGERPSSPFRSASTEGAARSVYQGGGEAYTGRGFTDTGGASRFFYTAKASRSEREAGMDDAPRHITVMSGETIDSAARDERENDIGLSAVRERGNHHPTVKPVDLMRWLCTLVTPRGGLVLDPFCGSGSTGVAALGSGFAFLGIEREPEYVAIARARLAHAAGPLFPEQEGAA